MNVKVGTVYIDVEPDVSRFSEKLRRNLQNTDMGKAVEQSLDRATKSTAKFSQEVDKTSVSLDRIGNKTLKFNNNMKAFQNIISLIKIPAVFAGLGVASAGLFALAGGAVAAVSALGPLIGLLVAAPAALFGIAASAATVKLAFSGIKEALKGTKGAMEKLGPAGKEFVSFLQGMKPLGQELKAIASSNLLPGITAGMKSAFSPSNLLAVKILIQETGKSLGDLATKLGKELAKPEWANAMTIGASAWSEALNRIGTALIGALGGVRDLVLAGRPLIQWMTDGIAKGIQLAGAWAKNVSASGKAAKFFEETKKVVKVLGGIFGNLASALVSIGKAAYPLGTTILGGLNNSLERLSKWAKSAGGQASLRAYFASTLPVLKSMVQLIGAISAVFFKVGQEAGNSGLTEFFDRLRTEVLPIFSDAVISSADGLADSLLDLVISFAKLASIMMSSSSPLAAFVGVLAKATGALADLLANNDKLAEFLTIFVAIVSISKLFNISGMIASLVGLTRVYWSQAVAAKGATVATHGLNVAMRANPIGLVVTALQLLAVGLFMAWSHSKTFRDVVKGSFSVVQKVIGAVVKFILDHWKLVILLLGGPVGAAILLLVEHFGSLKRVVGAVIGFIKDHFAGLKLAALKTVKAIIEPFSHLPGKMGKWARDAKIAIEGQLQSIKAKEITKNVLASTVPVAGQEGRAAGYAYRVQLEAEMARAAALLAASPAIQIQDKLERNRQGLGAKSGPADPKVPRVTYKPPPLGGGGGDLSGAAQKAADKAKAIIEAARSTFSTAFGRLSADALAAFDAKTSQMMSDVSAKYNKGRAAIEASLAKTKTTIGIKLKSLTDTLDAGLKSSLAAIDSKLKIQIAQIDAQLAGVMARLGLEGDALTASEQALADMDAAEEDARIAAISDKGEREKAILRRDLQRRAAEERLALNASIAERIAAAQAEAERNREFATAEAERLRLEHEEEAAKQRLHLEQMAAIETTAAEAKAAKLIERLNARETKEKLNLQALRDLARRHLADTIVAMDEQLQKHPEAWGRMYKRLRSLFDKDFGPNMQEAGANLGAAFVTGLRESIAAVERAAQDLKGAISRGSGASAGTGPYASGDVIPPGDITSGTFSGLTSHLQDEASLAAGSFAYQIQSYNPTSRLPNGAPSDHSVYPAKAFDAMFSPAIGWANTKARQFFYSMMGRPGIHYAILGDKIWSKEQGLHNYGLGGHNDHVHVSGYKDGGYIEPGGWGIVGEEGMELIKAGRAGATVVPMGDGGRTSLVTVENMSVRETVDIQLLAAALYRKAQSA